MNIGPRKVFPLCNVAAELVVRPFHNPTVATVARICLESHLISFIGCGRPVRMHSPEKNWFSDQTFFCDEKKRKENIGAAGLISSRKILDSMDIKKWIRSQSNIDVILYAHVLKHIVLSNFLSILDNAPQFQQRQKKKRKDNRRCVSHIIPNDTWIQRMLGRNYCFSPKQPRGTICCSLKSHKDILS